MAFCPSSPIVEVKMMWDNQLWFWSVFQHQKYEVFAKHLCHSKALADAYHGALTVCQIVGYMIKNVVSLSRVNTKWEIGKSIHLKDDAIKNALPDQCFQNKGKRRQNHWHNLLTLLNIWQKSVFMLVSFRFEFDSRYSIFHGEGKQH